MNAGKLIFTQVLDSLDCKQFQRCMALPPMPRASKAMTARDQFLAMAFAQITFRESLRDIEACLRGSAHRYAVRALACMEMGFCETKFTRDIAACSEVPAAYLAKTFKRLVDAGILESKRKQAKMIKQTEQAKE